MNYSANGSRDSSMNSNSQANQQLTMQELVGVKKTFTKEEPVYDL